MAEKNLDEMREAVEAIREKMAVAAREAGRDPAGVQLCAAVPGNVNAATKIKGFMENGKGFVFCHINFIQYAEAAKPCTLADRTFPENNFPVFESV